MAREEPARVAPLRDPLLAGRPFLIVALLVAVASAVIALASGDSRAALGAGFAVVGILPTLLLLPRKRAGAIYLRRFDADDHGYGPRLLIEAALHPDLRLAGIRAPRRRMPLFLRPLLFGLLAFRYANSRYMNLEAEQDWQARLWRTFADTRAAFVDLRRMSAHVEWETRFCLECLGPRRVFFIVDDSLPASGWLESIAAGVPVDPAREELHLGVWSGDDPESVERFAAEVRAFAAALPPDPPGLCVDAFPAVSDHVLSRGAVLRRRLLDGAQWLVGIGLVAAVNAIPQEGWQVIWQRALGKPWVLTGVFALSAYFLLAFGAALIAALRRNPLSRTIRKRPWQSKLRSAWGSALLLLAGTAVLVVIYLVLRREAGAHLTEAREELARLRLRELRDEVERFQVMNNRLPVDLWEVAEDGGLRAEALTDPWGGSYGYAPESKRQFRLWSNGPDGREGGGDDVTLP